MNPFAIICFLLDVLLMADEDTPMVPVTDLNLCLSATIAAGIDPVEAAKALNVMKGEGLIRVSSEGSILLTQKGLVSARRARFLLTLAEQDPTAN